MEQNRQDNRIALYAPGFPKKGEYKKEEKPSYQQSVQQVAQAVGGSAELGSKETIVDEVPF